MDQKPLSSSLEDYLEAIYVLCREDGAAHSNKIADYLGVGKSSVSWALGQLSQEGLVDYTPYKPIMLTETGQQRARQVASRHEQIKYFLSEILAVDEEAAESSACRMEHVAGKEVLERMKQFVTFVQMCPRGGNEWLEGFRYFVEHGRRRPDCPQKEPPDSEVTLESGPAPETEQASEAAVPKVSKERDRQLIDRFRKVLHDGGLELGRAEAMVMEVFMESERHQTLDQIYQQARRRDGSVDITMVERVMGLLCEYKIARLIRFRHQLLYEHHHPESHHDHLFCVKCGSIVEFFDPRLETLQIENAQQSDFRVLMHNLELFGVCSECIQREATIRSLSECLAGEVVKVLGITADSETARRLREMGLTAGVVLEVLSDRCTGRNVIVMAGAMRLMLDSDMARKVRVVPAQGLDPTCGMGRGRRRRHRHAAEGGMNG